MTKLLTELCRQTFIEKKYTGQTRPGDIGTFLSQYLEGPQDLLPTPCTGVSSPWGKDKRSINILYIVTMLELSLDALNNSHDIV
jgi:hypothetical protein